MKFIKSCYAVIPLTILILACNQTAKVVPTQNSSPTIQSQPTAPVHSGIEFNSGNIDMIIPGDLATGASTKTTIDVEYPYVNPSWGDMPSHIVITLNDYNLPNSNRAAQILIFKAAEFAAYTPKTADIITTLQNLPSDAGQSFPEVLTTTFYAKSVSLNSTTTQGIRYLTQVMDAFVTVNNEDLFYYYQGLTNDGLYYIEAILPINSEILPKNNSTDAVLPPEGIPFPFDNLGDNDARNGYYNAVRNKLNSAAQPNFQPSVDVLDDLVRSITILP